MREFVKLPNVHSMSASGRALRDWTEDDPGAPKMHIATYYNMPTYRKTNKAFLSFLILNIPVKSMSTLLSLQDGLAGCLATQRGGKTIRVYGVVS